jgi:hypothetical protein
MHQILFLLLAAVAVEEHMVNQVHKVTVGQLAVEVDNLLTQVQAEAAVQEELEIMLVV